MNSAAQPSAPTNGAADNPRRRKWLSALALILFVAGIVYGAYWFLVARHWERTDDAYVAGNVVQITPQITGTVLAIHADDTDFIQAGAPLVQLDQADARLALQRAESELAQTVRETRTLYTGDASLAATVRQREADLARAREDLARRQTLAGSGAVSREEIEHARTSLHSAEAALTAAREQLASNRVLIADTPAEKNPNVARAAAAVREAYLGFQRTVIPAPVSGYVAKRAVQVGQRVSPGTPLMAVVPLREVWVDANFKEVQLRHMRIGQPAVLTADIYGSKVEYHGKVVGLAAGTGAAFSLLPAQNATGNWIKVVQRLPVRIELDEKDLVDHPLRVGLSMQVSVNVDDERGAQLAAGGRRAPVAQTGVFAGQDRGGDALVERIIAANMKSMPPPRAREASLAQPR